MDFFLRHLNARGLVLMGGTFVFLAAALRYHDAPVRWYQNRLLAADRGVPAAAPDIARDLEHRQSQKLLGLYRSVCAEIADAKAHGRDVRAFQVAADNALAFNTPQGRAFAFDTLNKLRVNIPQPLDALRPAGAADVPADNLATPPAKPARRGAHSQ